MAIVTNILGTRTAQAVTGLAALASGNYFVSPTITATSSGLVGQDMVNELAVGVTAAPTGGQQMLVFAQASYDGGSTWTTGPTSGTSRADEPDLVELGPLPMRTAGTHRRAFAIAAAFDGICPPDYRLIVYNDTGVSTTSATLHTRRVVGDVT